MICDEMTLHFVNDISLSESTINSNFILLEDYRNDKLDKIFKF